jgi:thiol:disulfide interchange protein
MRGYSVAMSTSGPRMELVAAFEGIALLAVALFLLKSQERAKTRFLGCILAVPMVMSLKHSFVRQDAPHVAAFFSFIALALALVILSIRLNQRYIVTASPARCGEVPERSQSSAHVREL